MKTSRSGLLFILAREAVVLQSYQDNGKVWTIGAGHSVFAGPPTPRRGFKISLETAISLFQKDMARYETEVARAIHIDLKQHQFDALVSFHYNTGAIASGSVDNLINSGYFIKAMDRLEQYRNDDGKPIDGLKKRRALERAMFERGVYALEPIKVYDTYPGNFRLVSPDKILPAAPTDAVQPPSPDDPGVTPTPLPKPSSKPTIQQVALGLIAAAIAAFAAYFFGVSK